ncbi:rhodanese-like domain-containing protein [Neorhodopirellula pilleata]|uniref:Molybdopterin biosynthesis protein MoeB n=1 Tax=Neorhodopirellula pilleata TaxID=2714738 RepID=A0A5C5ZQ92_9BACT|nr:rhodanese-like domain-containing protein [Neorhodopirellula pilleata]TWT89366.1 molybdopterin biosynthesis protein MoeB [Neorhodopirellula pilleata]
MKSNLVVPMIALVLTLFVEAPIASAQFGGLFGGPTVETIETSSLAKMLQQQQQAETKANESGEAPPKSDFVVVDVRSEAEVNVSVIPGAITKAQYEKNKAQYQGRLVIPYCTVGGRSGAYAKQLAKAGVKVKNYQGSILEWARAGLPVVTLDGQPTNRIHTYSDRHRIPDKYEQVTE